MKEHPVIAIIGAGAVGGYYGGRLVQHGHNVHFLVRSDYDAIKQNGWAIRSIDGDFSIPPAQSRVYRSIEEMPKADLVIITIKSTANATLPAMLKPILHEQTLLLTLQNGIGCEDDLAAAFNPDHIVGGMAFVCINRLAPGVVHHMDHGMVRIGPFRESARAEARQIVEMFKVSKIRCEEIPDLKLGRWTKLVWNIPFNGFGAVMDVDTERLLSTEAGKKLVADLMAEVIAAANAAGVDLPASTAQTQIERTYSMGAYKSSSQVDRQMGRPLEIDAIFDRPLQMARKAGLKSPIWEQLVRQLRAIDR